VKNWREYDQSLRDRGDITLWISQDAIDAWTPPKTGKRGASPVYSDVAIETALTLRLLFRLPLRQTEGFLHSLLTLMEVTLPCPDHTRLCRKVGFWRQNPKMGYQKINDLRVSTFLFSVICDRAFY
jgi:hypothetical protein